MKSSAMKGRCTAWLPRIVFLLCLLQPVLDVLSFWLDELGLSNALTTVLRFAMLAAVVLLGFALSRQKRYYFALAAVLALLTAGHVAACSQWGYDAPLADLANTLRIYQLPLMTLVFITFVERNRDCLAQLRRGFFWCLLLCAAVEVLSVVTGTNPYTYENKSIGILGWFYFANSQSAILSMLVPVAIAYVLDRRPGQLWPLLAVTLAGLGVLYFLATRLAYMSMVAAGLGLAVSLVILGKTRGLDGKKAAAVLLACTIVGLAGYTVSPMYRNNVLVEQNKVLKQQDIDEKVAADEAAAMARGLEGQALAEARLASAYEEYLAGPTGEFGLSRTAALFDYSTDVGRIADNRLERLGFCRLLMEDGPGLSFWFGLEREDMSYDGVTYDVENDFHGIFYLCGAVGLALMLLFFAWFLGRIALALIRDFRGTFTLEAAGCGLALCCALAHAYFTAGVLRRPNATFYLAALLAVAYGLTRRPHGNIEVDS